MRIALALRDRLPRVEALYRQGVLSSRIVSSITWLTHLVEDEQALALIDAALADRAAKWGPLSEDKLRQAVEVWVSRYDPDALRHFRRPWPAAVTSPSGARDDNQRNRLGVGTPLAADAAACTGGSPPGTSRPGLPAWVSPCRRGRWPPATSGWPARADPQPARSPAEQPKSNVVIRVIADQSAVEAAQQSVEAATDNRRSTAIPRADPRPGRAANPATG